MNLSDFNINFGEVYKQLTSLNVKKGAGPDGLPNLFLKNCAAMVSVNLLHTYSTNLFYKSMNRGLDVHSLYTDFSKAFDMVNHEILIDKLSSYGVSRGKALSWFQSYLTSRHLQVRVNGHISEKYEVYSGVPQGSHLGPIIFTSSTTYRRS